MGIDECDVNSSYVSVLIDRINRQVSNELSEVFNFSEKTEIFNRFHSDRVVAIGNWQNGGVINSVTITSGGTGYMVAPSISLSDGNGVLECEISSGSVSKINIINQGSGYTVAPSITISGNATATCTVSTDLDVKLGFKGDGILSDLVEGDDYRFIYNNYINTSLDPNSIIGIELYFELLSRRNYIQVTGTKGYSGYVPDELMLDIRLYNLIKDYILSSENDVASGGRGQIKSTSIDGVRTDFVTENKMSTQDLMTEIGGVIKKAKDEYMLNLNMLPSIIG